MLDCLDRQKKNTGNLCLCYILKMETWWFQRILVNDASEQTTLPLLNDVDTRPPAEAVKQE